MNKAIRNIIEKWLKMQDIGNEEVLLSAFIVYEGLAGKTGSNLIGRTGVFFPCLYFSIDWQHSFGFENSPVQSIDRYSPFNIVI